MHDQDIPFPAELDNLAVHFLRAHAAGGIGRKRHNHIPGSTCVFFGNPGHIRQEAVFFLQRIIHDSGSRHFCACNKHGIARAGKQHCIPFIAQRQAQVAHALLGTIAGTDLVFPDLHAEALTVIPAHRRKHFRRVPECIFPVFRLHARLCHGFAYGSVRLKIRCAHAHVVQCSSLGLQAHFFPVQGSKHFIPEPVQAIAELHVPLLLRFLPDTAHAYSRCAI